MMTWMPETVDELIGYWEYLDRPKAVEPHPAVVCSNCCLVRCECCT